MLFPDASLCWGVLVLISGFGWEALVRFWPRLGNEILNCGLCWAQPVLDSGLSWAIPVLDSGLFWTIPVHYGFYLAMPVLSSGLSWAMPVFDSRL